MSLKQFSLNGLTLSIAPSAEQAGYGRVFLEAAGLRFGQDSVDEELDLFFYAAFHGFKSLSGVYPHLMNISSEQYRSLVNSVYDRCYSPVLFGEADGDVLVESTILRMEMAFDETLIGVFSDRDQERIVLHASCGGAELTLPQGTLRHIFSEAAGWVEKMIPPSGIYKGRKLSELWAEII